MKIIIFLLVCIASANAFFLNPSILTSKKKTEKTLCPDMATRESQDREFTGTRVPWFECSNAGLVHIDHCEIALSSAEECPTVYNARGSSGSSDRGYPPQDPRDVYDACAPGYVLSNTNCTALLSSTCNGQGECNFDWELLPEVWCIHVGEDTNDRPWRSQLQVNVAFTCMDKRKQCELYLEIRLYCDIKLLLNNMLFLLF